jgi:hypothetical protein
MNRAGLLRGIEQAFPVGGFDKPALLAELARNRIELNESARTILDSDRFVVSNASMLVTGIVVAVRSLQFPDGATTAAIYDRAVEWGLKLCSLEVGPYFRLHYVDQPEGVGQQLVRRHCAPPGSITIASPAPSADDAFPKGFYVRQMEGVLWLRGYRASADHVWHPDDQFLFCQC